MFEKFGLIIISDIFLFYSNASEWSCEDLRPENRFCGKLYRFVKCNFFVFILYLIMTPIIKIKILTFAPISEDANVNK